MKIKNVAVIFQNNVQYESFINAVDIMIERKINVDIFIPKTNDVGFNNMFDDFFEKISNLDYNVYRDTNKKEYDILFETYYIDQFKDLKRKYNIKYMYGLTTKPSFSLSFNINYIFDAFLCYGNEDAACLDNYGKTFKIGNIKYLKHQKVERKKEQKITILYLPTYSVHSSIEVIGNKLIELKKKYNIVVKPHHGTEYLENDIEKNRMAFLKNNFEKVFSSKDSIEKLINNCDIIISDLSGAVFDAVCLEKPVIMYYSENDNYGEYISLPIKCTKQKFFLSFNSADVDLEKLITSSLTKKQKEKQNTLFNHLFACSNADTKKRFTDFLEAIENDEIEEKYYLIHKQVKLEIDSLFRNYNVIDDLNYQFELLTSEYNKLKDENTLATEENKNLMKALSKTEIEYENFKTSIYTSTSWRITKYLRNLKMLIKKICNHE